ncbi:MAG: ABC-F family ATP-binding cassette domain-containing protein [Oscillospiraceae bacterium]|nr:ABC-F family ATP-binding cassette domain-containing protein [Oscillospiraceae bacterium]
MLLSAENISKNYGMKQLLDGVSVYLNEGDRIGIIGINGTGKSTLLRILAGASHPDSGNISSKPNLQISYLPQDPAMNSDYTVIEQVMADMPSEYREVNEYEARSMLDKLGISDFSAKIGTLSGGQRKRVALAAALIHPADVLILDEPTNHLDSEMVTWLENRLKKFNGGIIMITHDRYFLERVVTRIVELSRGSLYTYEANFSKYLELKAQREEMAEASERKRQSVLRREYQWIMRAARARGTKSKDRIERYYDLKNQSAPEYDDTVKISALSSRLGRKTIELKNISKSYGDKKVINDFSYIILRNDRIGIIGHNGAGKSTLLNMIAGRLAPDSGEVDTGETVSIGYFTQTSGELDPDKKVFDFIHDISDSVKTSEGTFSASQMLERFLFYPDLQQSLIGRLSGGEKRRLYLLSILMEAPNILLLDEPTNDLDIETLRILEDYIDEFPGAVISVSHDRYFLDKVAQSVFEVEDGGSVACYTGNYSDYIEKKAETGQAEKIKSSVSSSGVSSSSSESGRGRHALKFSFKEQREYETIDADIEAIEKSIAECEAEMAVQTSDYVKLQELTDRKAELEAELDAKTERWLYLNDLADRIEAEKKK